MPHDPAIDGSTWPVFVISLPDAEARRTRIRARLDAMNVPFSFVDAVDGRRGIAPEYEPSLDRTGVGEAFWREITDPEYACALSHMAVYRRIVDDGLPGAVVLEDDAIPQPAFKRFLEEHAYLKGELIQLDHQHGDVWRFSKPIRLFPSAHARVAAGNAGLTTGYSISRTGAAFILQNGLPLRRPADWPCDLTPLPAMLAVPRIVDHPDVDSADSAIASARDSAMARASKKKRGLRFFSAAYWRRWALKRMKVRIS